MQLWLWYVDHTDTNRPMQAVNAGSRPIQNSSCDTKLHIMIT